ncbi:hypothetical protein DFH06DRAFT_1335355 [Mycena polygramma]|nr:hypothetical protein DFH06DRAFT_1335355 [Mycena polygramma]
MHPSSTSISTIGRTRKIQSPDCHISKLPREVLDAIFTLSLATKDLEDITIDLARDILRVKNVCSDWTTTARGNHYILSFVMVSFPSLSSHQVCPLAVDSIKKLHKQLDAAAEAIPLCVWFSFPDTSADETVFGEAWRMLLELANISKRCSMLIFSHLGVCNTSDAITRCWRRPLAAFFCTLPPTAFPTLRVLRVCRNPLAACCFLEGFAIPQLDGLTSLHLTGNMSTSIKSSFQSLLTVETSGPFQLTGIKDFLGKCPKLRHLVWNQGYSIRHVLCVPPSPTLPPAPIPIPTLVGLTLHDISELPPLTAPKLERLILGRSDRMWNLSDFAKLRAFRSLIIFDCMGVRIENETLRILSDLAKLETLCVSVGGENRAEFFRHLRKRQEQRLAETGSHHLKTLILSNECTRTDEKREYRQLARTAQNIDGLTMTLYTTAYRLGIHWLPSFYPTDLEKIRLLIPFAEHAIGARMWKPGRSNSYKTVVILKDQEALEHCLTNGILVGNKRIGSDRVYRYE